MNAPMPRAASATCAACSARSTSANGARARGSTTGSARTRACGPTRPTSSTRRSSSRAVAERERQPPRDRPAARRGQPALQRARFAVPAESGPPRGANVAPIRRKARLLRDWVDAANVTDSQSAVVRLPSWAGCLVAMQEGVEPVMQIQCRDKNRIALQSDLLGAAALGIPNVLLLTGDHPRLGDTPDAKPVFDLDSIQLIWTARTMREQRKLLSGRQLKPAPDWFIGAVENPFAPPLQWRAERLGKKVAAGAQFVQTQFIYDVALFARWMEQVRNLGLDQKCFVLAGVGPIKSLRALEHMQREVPGLYVPEEWVPKLRGRPE